MDHAAGVRGRERFGDLRRKGERLRHRQGAAGDARFASGAGITSGQDASDRIVYNTTTDSLYYDADGSGPDASLLIGTFTNNPTLVATDLFVF